MSVTSSRRRTRSPRAVEFEELRARLEEAEETVRAIRTGEVDALVVSTPEGDRLFTLQGADYSYRALVEHMNEGALSLTADGIILYANNRLAAMLQVPLETVIGSRLESWLSPDDREKLPLLLQNAQHGQCRQEVTLVGVEGGTVPVNLSMNRVPIDGLHDSLGVVATDLTEQKQTERAVRLSEEKFRDVFENSLLGKRLVSMDGDVRVNRAFCEMLGYSEAELNSLQWQDYTHPEDIASTAEAFRRLEEDAAPVVRLEKRYIHKNGSTVWADATFTMGRDEAGNPLYFLASVNDITARKLADAAIQDLKGHLQRNIEMERLRLAQDLHDVPLQELYAVIYKLEELRGGSDSGTSEVLGEVIANIQRTLGSLRATASELRPPALSRFGLEKAIRSYAHEFQDKHPAIHVRLSLANDSQLLPEDLRLVLFRVLQEAIANIRRHAEATEIQIRFGFDAEEAWLEVSDNGKGFSVPSTWVDMVHEGHYGLAGMAERVSAAGGTVSVNSTPGELTTVRAVIPYGKLGA